MLLNFPFWRRRTIALELTETHVRLARGQQHDATVKLGGHAEAEFPTELLEKGDVQALSKVLQTLLVSAKESSVRDVVLLLPPSRVYTCLVDCTSHDVQSGKIHEEIAKIFPEDLSTLSFQTKPLEEEDSGRSVGAAAVQKSVLKTLLDACKKANLRITCVTTSPCILASRIEKKSGGDFLIISAAGLSVSQTVTLFHRGFPIDESVLPAGSSEKEVAGELRALFDEYRTHDLLKEKEGVVVVYGSAELLRECEDVMEKQQVQQATWSVVPAFPKASAAELPWLGLAAASMCRSEQISVNFVKEFSAN